MDMRADSLVAAKANAKSAWDRPYPNGLIVAPAWMAHQKQNRNKIEAFDSLQAAISFAQDGSKTGFDHRIDERVFAEKVCTWKLHELTRVFGFPAWAQESEFSSALTIDGQRLSTIFLTHLYYYQQIARLADQKKTILEIGGGYGGLARIFSLADPQVRYILTDLPESLFFAEVFLRTNFPNAKIAYGEWAPDFEFLLVPVQDVQTLRGQKVDVVINTGSFQEMTEPTNHFWMDFIQHHIETRFLYSFNYFLLNRTRHGETSEGAATRFCPILDDR